MNLTIIYAIGFSNGIFLFWRFLFAAVLGSAIATASIVMSFGTGVCTMLLPALMIMAAFGKIRFIYNCVMFFVYAALLSGIIYAGRMYVSNMVAMLLGIILLPLIVYFCFNIFKTQISKASLLMKIRCTYKGENIDTVALADTGNRLCDPYTGRPVMVIDKELYTRIFGNGQTGMLIPYKSIGGDGFLIARTVDEIEYEWEGRKIVNKNVVLAGCNGKVAKNGEYEAIFHTDLVRCK